MSRGFIRGCIAGVSTFVLGASLALYPAAAVAEPSLAELQRQVDELVGNIEEASEAYTQATAEVERLAALIAQNQEKSASIEQQLPAQRERTAASVKSMYLLQQSSPGLLELMLMSRDLNDFITTLRCMDAIYDHNTTQINALTQLDDELTQTQQALESELDVATGKQSEALLALEEVRTSRENLQAQIRELQRLQAEADAARKKEAEAIVQSATSAAEEAVSALPPAAAQATAPQEESGSQAAAQPTPAPAQDASSTVQESEPAAEQEQEQQEQAQPESSEPAAEEPAQVVVGDANVASWAARIDAYLAGSPLAGYGSVFAQAAIDNGIDPRISPAISCIESSKGAVCFRSHNAWGWGSSGWGSWEEAIRAHVAGYASIYGSTVTLDGAAMYAGADIATTWYNLVVEEMNSI